VRRGELGDQAPVVTARTPMPIPARKHSTPETVTRALSPVPIENQTMPKCRRRRGRSRRKGARRRRCRGPAQGGPVRTVDEGVWPFAQVPSLTDGVHVSANTAPAVRALLRGMALGCCPISEETHVARRESHRAHGEPEDAVADGRERIRLSGVYTAGADSGRRSNWSSRACDRVPAPELEQYRGSTMRRGSQTNCRKGARQCHLTCHMRTANHRTVRPPRAPPCQHSMTSAVRNTFGNTPVT